MKYSFLSQLFRSTTCKVACLVLPAFSWVAVQPCHADFEGTLTGVSANDTLLIYMNDMFSRSSIKVDTVALSDSHFKVSTPDQPVSIQVFMKPKGPKGALRMMARRPFMLFPGEHLKAEGPLDNLKLSGTEIYDGLAECTEVLRLGEQLDKVNTAYSHAYQAKDKTAMDSLKKVARATYDLSMQAKLDVVKARPNSAVAVYLLMEMKPEIGLKAVDLLSEDLKKGKMAPLIENCVRAYQSSIAREQAKENIKPGKVAPDFKMKNLSGKEVSLSTFKGKYLLLDFWGTWCGWCIKGIPEMKKYYDKYNSKIEYLGICCRDTEKDWRAAVAKHQLPWVNVLDVDSKMTDQYAVPGYPTKILIDPQGKIVEVFVGESPALYQKLDALFQ